MKIASCMVLGVVLLGCQGHTKPVAAPAPARAEVTPQDERFPYAEVAAPSPAAPAELDGVWLHVRSPSELWRKLPRLAQEVQPLAALREVTSTDRLPSDVAAVVDVSEPVDLIVPLPGVVQTTWSFRVRSPDSILRGTAGLTLRRVSAGAWDIGGVSVEPPEVTQPEAPDDESDEWQGGMQELPDVRCRLLHHPAPVGFRVVCGRDYRQLALSADFLLSPARALETDADVHLELGGASYHELKNQSLRAIALSQPGATSSEARGALLVADFAKALYEHRRASLDVTLRGNSARARVELTYPAQLESTRFAEWLVHASQASLPSGSAALPHDSGLALTYSGTGEGGLRYALSELLESISEDCVVSPAQLAELDTALSSVLPSDGRVSFAYGIDTEAAYTALNDAARRLSDDTQRPLSAATVKRVQAALGGWMVLGVDLPSERFLPAARRAHRVSQVKLPLKQGRTESETGSTSNSRLAPPPAGLPPGTLHFVEESRTKSLVGGDAPPAPLPFDRHYLVVPDGKRVWIVLSRGEALAVARARALLGERRALPWSSLAQEGRPALLATVDLRSIVALGLEWDSREQRADALASLARLSQASRQGAARVPLRVDVLPVQGSESGHLVRVQTEVDLAELVVQAFALMPPAPEEQQ